MFKSLKRVWRDKVKFRIVKNKCLRSSFYRGKLCCIRKGGYSDLPIWHVAIYKCPNISQAVRAFYNLDEAISRFMEVEGGELQGEIRGGYKGR